MTTTKIRWMKMTKDDREAGVKQLAENERDKLLVECIVSQQEAGFERLADGREVPCDDCGAPGFNTGWGFWKHTCGRETITDGTPSEPCGAQKLDAA